MAASRRSGCGSDISVWKKACAWSSITETMSWHWSGHFDVDGSSRCCLRGGMGVVALINGLRRCCSLFSQGFRWGAVRRVVGWGLCQMGS